MRSLFFALWPDPDLRAALHARARRLHARWGGRATRAAGYHLTLSFLGRHPALPVQRVEQARAAAARVAVPAFELCLDRAGTFAGPGVGWLGCARPPVALRDLARALAAGDDATACDADSFVPHVTVLRGLGSVHAAPIAGLRWKVTGFRLLATAPAAGPAPYDTLGAWTLR